MRPSGPKRFGRRSPDGVLVDYRLAELGPGRLDMGLPSCILVAKSASLRRSWAGARLAGCRAQARKPVGILTRHWAWAVDALLLSRLVGPHLVPAHVACQCARLLARREVVPDGAAPPSKRVGAPLLASTAGPPHGAAGIGAHRIVRAALARKRRPQEHPLRGAASVRSRRAGPARELEPSQRQRSVVRVARKNAGGSRRRHADETRWRNCQEVGRTDWRQRRSNWRRMPRLTSSVQSDARVAARRSGPRGVAAR